MKLIFTSQASKQMAHFRNRSSRLETFIIPKIEEEILKVICSHHNYCKVRTFGRINCLTEASVKTCQTYKFYQRYGREYASLGVGN